MSREDLIHNEKMKLEATFFNNMAVGILLAFGYTSVLLDMDEWKRVGVAISGVVLSALGRWVARLKLDKLRDA